MSSSRVWIGISKRINLMKRHPGSLKLVHLLPAVFTLGVFACLFLLLIGGGLTVLTLCPNVAIHYNLGMALTLAGLVPLLLFSFVVFVDSSFRNKSCKVGVLSIWASFIQLLGYGTGFLRAWWLRCVCGRNEELQAFKENFYA